MKAPSEARSVSRRLHLSRCFLATSSEHCCVTFRKSIHYRPETDHVRISSLRDFIVQIEVVQNADVDGCRFFPY